MSFQNVINSITISNLCRQQFSYLNYCPMWYFFTRVLLQSLVRRLRTMLSFLSLTSRTILCVRHYCKNTMTKLKVSEAISGSKLGANIKVQVRMKCLWLLVGLLALFIYCYYANRLRMNGRFKQSNDKLVSL